jgi:hypothetical protein
MTYYAYHKMIDGWQVWSNFPIKFKYRGRVYEAHHFTSESELIRAFYDMKHGLVLFDEAGTMFPTEEWKRLPMWVKAKFRESRKDRIDIYYSAQDLRDVVNSLRRLTDETCYCVKVPLWGIFWRLPVFHPATAFEFILRGYHKRFLSFWWGYLRHRNDDNLVVRDLFVNRWKKYKGWAVPMFVTWITAISMKGYFSNGTYNYTSGRHIFGKKWWESIRRTDLLRPGDWWAPAQSYDTMQKPDHRFKPKGADVPTNTKNQNYERNERSYNDPERIVN